MIKNPVARHAWREGFLPQLNDRQLAALRDGLMADDHGLLQETTTSPPPMACVSTWPVEGACLVAYAGWKGGGAVECAEGHCEVATVDKDSLLTVGEVQEFFSHACFEADKRLGEPAACRYLLNWWDDTPRDQAVVEMLGEVELAMQERP